MKHLTSEEFVDVVEGTLSERRAAHVVTCGACARQAELLRSAAEAARVQEVPEPSPLFWDHLSRRVRDAVEAGPPAWVRHRGHAWLSWRAAVPVALGVMLVAVVVDRARHRKPTPAERDVSAVASQGVPTDETPTGGEGMIDRALGDQWEIVAAVAEQIEWDELDHAVVAVPPGAADLALEELSLDERRELARLLEAALARSTSS